MTFYKYHQNNSDLPEYIKHIFVFGSNLAGRHGLSAAKFALDHRGAKWGCGVGLQGQSYAIPTKDRVIKTLPLEEIKQYIILFKEYTQNKSKTSFFVTRIGCGLAGYTDAEIAPMFKGASKNCVFPIEWKSFLED